jgi:hypothetical protein
VRAGTTRLIARSTADEAAAPTSRQPHGRRGVLVRRVLAGADVVALVAALAVAILAAHATPQPLLRLALLIATLPIWLVLFKLYGLYDRDARGVNHSTRESPCLASTRPR